MPKKMEGDATVTNRAPTVYILDNNGNIIQVDECTARAMFECKEEGIPQHELPPVITAAEVQAEYYAYLANQGKTHYETPEDARRAVEDIDNNDFTLVTKRKKKKKSDAAPAEVIEPTPSKKDKRKKKQHASTQESDAYISEGNIKKTRN